MAKYLKSASKTQIDIIFKALADPTRRDILERLSVGELSVTEIAKSYSFSLPTISKHLSVLLKAQLIQKEKVGRIYYVRFEANTMKAASEYIASFKKIWSFQFGNIETFLSKVKKG